MTLLPGILPGALFSKCATVNLGLIPSFKQASSGHVILVWVFFVFSFFGHRLQTAVYFLWWSGF